MNPIDLEIEHYLRNTLNSIHVKRKMAGEPSDKQSCKEELKAMLDFGRPAPNPKAWSQHYHEFPFRDGHAHTEECLKEYGFEEIGEG